MQLFTIKRNLLCANLWKGGLNPGDETALERFWVDTCKHAIEGVVRRDASRQAEKCLKPGLLLICNHCNFTKTIRTTDGAADRHNDNFYKDVLFIMVFSIIGDGIEVGNQSEFRPVHTTLLKRSWING